MFENFWGNAHATEALEHMLTQDRLAQTLLFSGPEGVGKATLARCLGAHLLGHPELIEKTTWHSPITSKPSARVKSGPPRSATKIRCSSRVIRTSSPSPPTARCARSRFRRPAP